MGETPEQINAWANRALENLYGGWFGLAEHQLILIIEATGALDEGALAARGGLAKEIALLRDGEPPHQAARPAADAGGPPATPGEDGP